MSTEELREQFLVPSIMQDGELSLLYTHYDRMIIGGVKPLRKQLSLPNPTELKAGYFLERRELGIINVGGGGSVKADGVEYKMDRLDCLYLGKGTRQVNFISSAVNQAACFYLLSAPAHRKFPSKKMPVKKASPVRLGAAATSNQRTIYKYIHPGGIQSCQLVMGLTLLEEGSVWNSVPPHTHTRRMEVYFYFDLPPGNKVFHFMGEPQQTRHLVVGQHEAVISPPWSVHYGCGTSHYGFIWGMAGENQAFTDMDQLSIEELK